MTRFISFLCGFGICATVGCMAGSFAGLFFGGMLLGAPGHHIALSTSVVIGACLGLLAWTVILWILSVVGHYVIGDVVLPALLTCLLVSVVTVLVVDLSRLPAPSMLIGWIIGFTIGAALCRFCIVASPRRTG